MMILKSVTFTNETDPPTRAPPHPRYGFQCECPHFYRNETRIIVILQLYSVLRHKKANAFHCAGLSLCLDPWPWLAKHFAKPENGKALVWECSSGALGPRIATFSHRGSQAALRSRRVSLVWLC